jgi:hypothetical protein
MGHMTGFANDLALALVSKPAACRAYCLNIHFRLNIHRMIALFSAAERLFVAIPAQGRIGIISPKKCVYDFPAPGRNSVRCMACGALKQSVFIKWKILGYTYFV